MATIAYSSMAFADDLTRVVRASRTVHTVRACLLTTRDRDRALRMLRDVVTACEQPLYHCTVVGRRRYIPDKLRWEAVGSGAPDAAELLRCASELRGGVVVLEDCAAFLRDGGRPTGTHDPLADALVRDGKRGACSRLCRAPRGGEPPAVHPCRSVRAVGRAVSPRGGARGRCPGGTRAYGPPGTRSPGGGAHPG
jgi:hypothetical protein